MCGEVSPEERVETIDTYPVLRRLETQPELWERKDPEPEWGGYLMDGVGFLVHTRLTSVDSFPTPFGSGLWRPVGPGPDTPLHGTSGSVIRKGDVRSPTLFFIPCPSLYNPPVGGRPDQSPRFHD